jgi:hypothetical protein
MMRMRRGPGLVGAVARTAVVAGTATAVSGRVARRQANRYAEEQQAAAPAAPAASGADSAVDQVAELQKLAQMQEQGLLTPEEFATMKAKVVGS